ncbi:MAG: hypothetical protein KGM24_15300 [Elusimicrobia bacterium]|nr:hypothetical protein [Elusimicrobiota bacterium]
MSGGTLFLIPWHIGNALDTTYRAAELVRRLDLLLVEDLDDARFQLKLCLGVDAGAKTLREIPEEPSPRFRDELLSALQGGDAGLLSSGGVPGFVDPGAWLVADLRARGAPVRALAGPSVLSTMLSLSGVEWRQHRDSSFTFAFFPGCAPGSREEEAFLAVARRPETILVLLRPAELARCLALLRAEVGPRPVTLFFDLTKPPGSFALADQVRTMTCAEWLGVLSRLPWDGIGDLALMVGR